MEEVACAFDDASSLLSAESEVSSTASSLDEDSLAMSSSDALNRGVSPYSDALNRGVSPSGALNRGVSPSDALNRGVSPSDAFNRGVSPSDALNGRS